MENRRVPEYYKVDQPEEVDPAYLEWWERRLKELAVTEKAFVQEFWEYRNYEPHRILPTVYLDVVNNGVSTLKVDCFLLILYFLQIREQTEPLMPIISLLATTLLRVSLPQRIHIPFGQTSALIQPGLLSMELIKELCIVTRHQILDMTRLAPFYHEFSTTQIMCGFAQTIISLVECLPYDDTTYNDDDLRLCFGHMIEKPFSVDSVVPDTKKVHESSGDEDISYEYDVTKAAMFLEENMKSGLEFTIDETIQINSNGGSKIYMGRQQLLLFSICAAES